MIDNNHSKSIYFISIEMCVCVCTSSIFLPLKRLLLLILPPPSLSHSRFSSKEWVEDINVNMKFDERKKRKKMSCERDSFGSCCCCFYCYLLLCDIELYFWHVRQQKKTKRERKFDFIAFKRFTITQKP